MVDLQADLRQRLDRTRKAMAEQSIGALAIYSSGQHNMLRMDQVFWLTDFRSIGPAVLLVPATGATKLLVAPQWDLERAREAAGVEQVQAFQEQELAQAVRREAQRLPQPVGLSGRDAMPVRFAEELGVKEFGNAEKLIPGLGATRTPAELQRVSKAAQIADLGFQALQATAHVGMREYELAAEIEAAMQIAGSEDNFGLLGAGARNVAIRPPTERRLEAGDVIIGEITPCCQGYFAQLCRTFILGEPSELQRQKYDMLVEAQDRGFDAAKPGQPSANIARAVNGVITAAGYGEYCRQPYMRTRGHGLGFGGVVPYDVTEDSSPTLQENMTFVIHPNQYIPETGYMMLGDTVVIEPDGPRPLTQTPRQLFWQAG
ncbi:MAG TPA: Xaa-Pro peptidase family protein [Chloroflexota bacterium]|nr:Xaa-Pro peptidase family protein [Chloroflexota bacterium]